MTETTHSILIVDDEPEIQELLSILITSEGYQPVKASNGTEALALLENNRFDAIISDVQMPQMNGYQLIVKTRENSATTDIPFIFISVHTTLGEMLQGYNQSLNKDLK